MMKEGNNMSDAILEKYYYNFELKDTADFDSTYHAVNPSVYEVIRVMDGTPLFLSEHYERMVSSLASVGEQAPFTLERLGQAIRELCLANGVTNHNIKLVINDFEKVPGGSIHLFAIATSYPSEDMYESGVPTDLFNAVRNNPNAKIIDQALRDSENSFIKENNLFEALLVNEADEITEGSRSNIFFVKGDALCTSPAEGVLLGVTRQRVIRICRSAGIEVREEPIPVSRLSDYSAAFISGTSPKVLPISCIGSNKLDVRSPLLRRVMDLYDQEIKNYIDLEK